MKINGNVPVRRRKTNKMALLKKKRENDIFVKDDLKSLNHTKVQYNCKLILKQDVFICNDNFIAHFKKSFNFFKLKIQYILNL